MAKSSSVETLRSVPIVHLFPYLLRDCLPIDIILTLDLPPIGMTCANPLPIGCEIHRVGLVIGLTTTWQMDLGLALYCRLGFGLWDWFMIGRLV